MKSKVVISLIPGKVVSEIVDSSKEDPIIQREIFEWKKGSLDLALEEAISSLEATDSVRVIVSDQFCHVVGLTVEKKKSTDRAFIKKQVGEFIPEDLDVVPWDYVVKNIVDGKAKIQVFSLTKLLSDDFNSVDEQVKKRIKLILPCSITLLESFAEKDQSFLLVHSGTLNKVITAVINGVVKFAVTFNEKNVSKKVLESLSYLKQYVDFAPEQIVLSGDLNTALNKELKKNFTVVSSVIIPEINLIEINRVSGQDQKTLNIAFSSEKSEGVLAKLEENIQNKQDGGSNQNVIFTMTLIVIAILGIGLGYLFVSQVLT